MPFSVVGGARPRGEKNVLLTRHVGLVVAGLWGTQTAKGATTNNTFMVYECHSCMPEY